MSSGFKGSDPQSVAQQLYALPQLIQSELLGIARLALGMSAQEKASGRMLLGLLGAGLVDGATDEQVPSAQMLGHCGVILARADELSGDSSSWMVAR